MSHTDEGVGPYSTDRPISHGPDGTAAGSDLGQTAPLTPGGSSTAPHQPPPAHPSHDAWSAYSSGGTTSGIPWGATAAPGSAPGGGPHGTPWTPSRVRDANPLRAATDLSFGTYATPGLVKVVYVLAIVLGVLGWISSVIVGFAVGAAQSPFQESTPIYGLLNLFFGWIPVVLWVLLVRIGLEFAIANVRTAEDIRNMRAARLE